MGMGGQAAACSPGPRALGSARLAPLQTPGLSPPADWLGLGGGRGVLARFTGSWLRAHGLYGKGNQVSLAEDAQLHPRPEAG